MGGVTAEIVTLRGRPKKYDKPRGNLTFRIRDEVRKTLQDNAAANQRSLSEEVEARLERSLREDELVSRIESLEETINSLRQWAEQ